MKARRNGTYNNEQADDFKNSSLCGGIVDVRIVDIASASVSGVGSAVVVFAVEETHVG